VRSLGQAAKDRYWQIFEELRSQLGYADYLGALERYRMEHVHDPRLFRLSGWLVDYPFAGRLYPGALETVRHVRRWGLPVILSDGDAVFQPRKIERSGLWQAFEGQVLIYIHKEAELQNVQHAYPARRYILIDDKPRILDAAKQAWRQHVTTVFPKQGHYANDDADARRYGPPDVTVGRIGDLMSHDFSAALAS
jgi:FMN phosphatase YigB (HAD superfamily)